MGRRGAAPAEDPSARARALRRDIRRAGARASDVRAAQHLPAERELRFHHRRASGQGPHRRRHQPRDVGPARRLPAGEGRVGRGGRLAPGRGAGDQGRRRRRRHGHLRADPRRVGQRLLRGGRRADLLRHHRASRAAQPLKPAAAVVRCPLPAGEPTRRRDQHGPLCRLRHVGGGLRGLVLRRPEILLGGALPHCRALRPQLLRTARPDGLRHGGERRRGGAGRAATYRAARSDAAKRERAERLLHQLDTGAAPVGLVASVSRLSPA